MKGKGHAEKGEKGATSKQPLHYNRELMLPDLPSR